MMAQLVDFALIQRITIIPGLYIERGLKVTALSRATESARSRTESLFTSGING